MPQDFTCLVINLDGSDDRLRAVSAALGRASIDFDRLPATDGRALGLDTIDGYDDDRAIRYMGRGLVGGEVGCYLSHLAAARAFLDTSAQHGLIVEDDAAPPPDLRRIVERTTDFLDAADPAWRIVNLGNEKLKLSTPCLEIEAGGATYILERAFYFPMTTVAILWSRRGAAEFVAEHDRIFAPVDHSFRHWITRVGGGYAFAPPPVPNTAVQSDIAGLAGVRRSRTRRHSLYGWRKQRRLWIDKIIALRRKLTTAPLRRTL